MDRFSSVQSAWFCVFDYALKNNSNELQGGKCFKLYYFLFWSFLTLNKRSYLCTVLQASHTVKIVVLIYLTQTSLLIWHWKRSLQIYIFRGQVVVEGLPVSYNWRFLNFSLLQYWKSMQHNILYMIPWSPNSLRLFTLLISYYNNHI